jgi:hypothetical protein
MKALACFRCRYVAGTFEFLCRSTITAPTLAEAIDRSIRFLRLVLPDLAVRLDSNDEQACLCIRETRPLKSGGSSPSNGCCACCMDCFPGLSGAASFSIRSLSPTPARRMPRIMR